MDLFSESRAPSAAISARRQVKMWELNLANRIALQKSLDLCNKFPLADNVDKLYKNSSTEGIKLALSELSTILDSQVQNESKNETRDSSRKRKFDVLKATDDDIWSHLYDTQSTLKRNWRISVDKWHARVNYGSEKNKSKLKVLSTSIWDQVHAGYSIMKTMLK